MGIKKTIIMGETGPVGVRFETEGVGAFEVRYSDLFQGIIEHATWHGISQKIGDAAALSKGATDTEKHAAMIAMRDQICGPDGEWNRRAEGGDTMLARAVAEWTGQPLADVAAQLKAQTAEFRRALEKQPEIAEILARYRAAKPVPEAAKTAAAEFLAGLKKV